MVIMMNCVDVSDGLSFFIKVDERATMRDAKVAIKTSNPNTFGHIDFRSLLLFAAKGPDGVFFPLRSSRLRKLQAGVAARRVSKLLSRNLELDDNASVRSELGEKLSLSDAHLLVVVGARCVEFVLAGIGPSIFLATIELKRPAEELLQAITTAASIPRVFLAKEKHGK
ncbi:hypothetical protein PHYSODRAFT_294360 [Phytophthora sojae]|uniref:Crinkler effector protein N-terminal domain-containing protein n=1 Tax=Phytophthora sojae (strain P6497) TaxID=1094619 RepID=G4YE03_PHYSP|nr:hypothetical protein PHYSODRAFT_294360 [Phytophthora sojae]EGZ29021.1 hypothetical protein PHYSODRAFT_294360 [Phytophthora sojae]|eukprot:XP_009516296.1 hypothetical protein PHYSODRAFT_294360 [Phytophthora sojae]